MKIVGNVTSKEDAIEIEDIVKTFVVECRIKHIVEGV